MKRLIQALKKLFPKKKRKTRASKIEITRASNGQPTSIKISDV